MRRCTALTTFLLLSYAPSTLGYFSDWYRDYYPQPNHYCVYGCKALAPYITFDIPVAASFDIGQCTNNIKLESLYHCGQAHCTPTEYRDGIDYLSKECRRNAGVSLPDAAELALAIKELDAMPRLNITSALATSTMPLTSPAIPNALWHGLAVRSVSAYYFNWSLGFMYSWGMYGFWGLVLLIGIINRIVEQVSMRRSASVSTSSGSQLWLWTRRQLILPATFRNHCQEPLGWSTIPPRLETLIITLYIAMVFIMCFPGYHLFLGNQYYPAYKTQIARYISDRSGFMAIAQLPIVWLFAARNDPFLWLTGWSYATYNRFHRWVARVTVILAIVHSVGFSIFSTYSKTWKTSWTQQYWYCGVIATIVMSLMLGISIHYFRQKVYDLFLIIHISLAVIALVGIYLHVETYPGEFYGFIWPCVAMWSVDRLLRLARVAHLGLLPRLSRNAKAVASYDEKTEMIRLDVSSIINSTTINPGHVYYVYVPGSIKGYESHPFTLCSWRENDSENTVPLPEVPMSSEKTEIEAHPSTVVARTSSSGKTRHTFLIRPYTGSSFTGRLQTLLANAANEGQLSTNLTVFLEGPYRQKLDLSAYSDILIIAGGSGITPAISHAHYLLEANETTRVHIHWAVPQRDFADDLCRNELATAILSERLSLTVYLATTPSKIPTHATAEQPGLYKVCLGRPDVEVVMREQRNQCDRSLAVVTCGRPQMADACRAAVCRILADDGPPVGYFNETLTW